MSKFYLLILFFIFYASLIFIPATYAQTTTVRPCDNPRVQTIPLECSRSDPSSPNYDERYPCNTIRNPLSDDKKVRYTVDVNREANEGRVKKWLMEFQCGVNLNILPIGPGINIRYQINEGQPIGSTNIYTELDNSGTFADRCEFDPKRGPIGIRVKAEFSDNTTINFCEASYSVEDADKLCQLELIRPGGTKVEKNDPIVIGNFLSISGKKLTQNGKFVLLFDGQAVWAPPITQLLPGLEIPSAALVGTPTFSGYPIDNNRLTIGTHTVSLHRKQVGGFRPAIIPGSRVPQIEDILDKASICSITFSVGTPAKPGKIISEQGDDTGSFSRVEPCLGDNCTRSQVDPCDDSTDPTKPNPGIQTAIGCIHTSPVGFVKDALKFGLGIGGGLAFLMMLLGAFQMLTSAGNPETLATGRDRLTNAVIGLLFVIFSVLLLQIIGVGILDIPGFK